MLRNHVADLEPYPNLNTAQRYLLQQTSNAGMTPMHLSLWVPYATKDNEHAVFSQSHAVAVLFFMNSLHMKPLAAIHALQGLDAKEADLLPHYYSSGLTGDFINRARNNYSFHLPSFQAALHFLTAIKKLSLQRALIHLEHLDDGRLVVLQDLYRYGLRGHHLRSCHLSDACKLYTLYRNDQTKADSSARDAAKYFRKIYRAARHHQHLRPAEALRLSCSELLKIKHNVKMPNKSDARHVLFLQSSKRINFLLAHVNLGVRADDYPRAFTPYQQKIFNILYFYHLLDLPKALSEMQGFADDKLAFMCKYYSEGMYNRRLECFPHHTAFCESFMQRLHWSATQAVDNLAPLSPDQLLYFHFLQPFGLTLAEVNLLKPKTTYTHARKDAAIFLINEKGYAPTLALQEVIVSNDDDLKQMLQQQPGHLFQSARK